MPNLDARLAQKLASLSGLTAQLPYPHDQELRRVRHDLVVRARVKEFALAAASTRKLSTGQRRFTRVHPSFIDRIAARTRAMIEAEFASLPSCGRTIR